MRSHCLTALVLCMVCLSAAWAEPRGPVVSLNPSMDVQALQSALMQAPPGASVVFAAGKYNLTSALTIPCKNLQFTGPVAATPTATLSALYQNGDIFVFNGGCNSLGSFRHLHFEKAGAIFFGGGGDNSNLLFEHNLVTELPSGLNNNLAETALYFDGSLTTKLKNVVIRYNTFGDEKSCVAIFATVKDEGGYCGGVITHEGEVNGITIEYNNFFHVEQGVHFLQLAEFKPGQPNSVCISCKLRYNYILNYHRIGIEIQISTPNDSILVEHNAIVDPLNSSWGTYAVSMACCQSGFVQTVDGHSPGYIFNDNVLVASKPIGSMCPPYGVEFWGTGPQGTNSLIQGTFCHGYTWGFGAGSWSITHNYICGPNYLPKGGYITNQQRQNNPPAQSDNITDTKCLPTASTPPTFKQPGGDFVGPQVVEIFDKGANTGIWYTTDGSTPVPGSGTAQRYNGPLKITRTTAVKAVGMWGAPNQPLSYPPGYGYIPSSVVTASYVLTPNGKQVGPKG